MKVKTARVYTLDELKEKCQKALADPKLVEIVKTAPLNKDGKVNLSWVYKEAEKYVHGETKDLQKTKELAVETRFLAMLRRDHEEEFEKLVSARKPKEEDTTKPETKQESFWHKEFTLPDHITVITRTSPGGRPSISIQFAPATYPNGFCSEILEAMLNDANTEKDGLRAELIKLLEEKFGLKVKVCMNCAYYYGENNILGVIDGNCRKAINDQIASAPLCYMTRPHETCEHWTPKEVAEKTSSA